MQKRWILVFVLGLALSACGMIEVQGQIIDPTKSVQTQITTDQEPTDMPTEMPADVPTETPEPPVLSFEAVT